MKIVKEGKKRTCSCCFEDAGHYVDLYLCDTHMKKYRDIFS